MNSQGISCRISKVNEQLEKLSSLIQNDHNFYYRAKEALQQFHEHDSSQDSFNYFQIENHLAASRCFNQAKIQVISNFQQQQQSILHYSTAKSGLSGISALKQSKIPDQQVAVRENIDNRAADVTIKKFRPVDDPNKKKKESEQKIKEKSKLKNSKSENKLNGLSNPNTYKNESFKKQNKKQLKKSTNQYQLNNNFKGLYKKTKTTNNIKTTSQNRLNESLKMNMHINLDLGSDLKSNFKKEVNMKITDLNIQKIKCQKQAEYLKSVMKVEQKEKLQAVMQSIEESNEQSAIYVFMGRLIVNFFSQFFHERMIRTQQCNCEQLQNILQKKNYLIKYMLKLPDILKKDNTLCEQRCKRLFEEKHFIDHRVHTSHKNLQIDILYQCVDCLHDYISFLINNNVVHQTKRRMLPIQFHSERSGRNAHKNVNLYNLIGATTNINTVNPIAGINLQNAPIVKERQYDSDRKCRKQSSKSKSSHPYQSNNNPNPTTFVNHHKSINNGSKSTLKRTNTKKMLSPKPKTNPKLSRNANTSCKQK